LSSVFSSVVASIFFSVIRRDLVSILSPYTTLFRSLKKIPGGYFWGSLLGNDAVFERAYRVGGSFSSCAPPSSFHVFLLSVIDGSQLCKFSQILYQNLCETGTCKANSTWQ